MTKNQPFFMVDFGASTSLGACSRYSYSFVQIIGRYPSLEPDFLQENSWQDYFLGINVHHINLYSLSSTAPFLPETRTAATLIRSQQWGICLHTSLTTRRPSLEFRMLKCWHVTVFRIDIVICSNTSILWMYQPI